ncbi:MAG: hypothetical protein IT291_09600 [Deltaproteobacteria bacterium]|nr:hypothetical protein [Deltaproteobacteria bacterium]
MKIEQSAWNYINVSVELEKKGLVWHPEIGDEVSDRNHLDKVCIFVDPQGLTPKILRETFVWLPTVEQLVEQFEARQVLIYHAGINERLVYEAIVKTSEGVIETSAETLRLAFGKALSEVLENSGVIETLH